MEAYDLIIKYPINGSMHVYMHVKSLNNKICMMCMKISKAVDLIYNNQRSKPNN